jgi:S-adenosylmethionine/arginine decarboxylase-like enzyme
VLNNIDHNFKPFGYSTVWLLAESHFAIHTFPEENKIYYELSSCNEEFYKRFNYNLRTYFKEIKRKWEKAK